jgi:hypothetical protein
VARRSNYGFEKRQRELKKQKKKEAKAEAKRLKREAAAAAAAGETGDGGEVVAGSEGGLESGQEDTEDRD